MAVTDILSSNAILWYAPVGEAPPADTVPYGTPWGGNWATLGLTKAPLAMLFTQDMLNIEVEESLPYVDQVKTSERLAFETTLAEVTSTNLGITGQVDATITPPGIGIPGTDKMTLGNLNNLTDKWFIGFEGRYVTDTGIELPVRVFAYKGAFNINGNLEFSRADWPGIPIHVECFADLTRAKGDQLYSLTRVTAEAL